MKKITEIEGTYEGKALTKLVDILRNSSLSLPESQHYHFEMHGDIVHVYGDEDGINMYKSGAEEQKERAVRDGVELILRHGGKILLHSKPYSGIGATKSNHSSPVLKKVGSSGESRYAIGESRVATPLKSKSKGESGAGCGESRSTCPKPKTLGESRTSGGESKPAVSRKSRSKGESRSSGGES